MLIPNLPSHIVVDIPQKLNYTPTYEIELYSTLDANNANDVELVTHVKVGYNIIFKDKHTENYVKFI